MTNRWILGALGVGVLAHGLLLAPLPLLGQALAALVIAGFLPGLLLVEALVGQSASRPDGFERVLYSAATAYTVMVVVMLLVSYLPGGPTQLVTLLAFDAVTLALAGWIWWRGRCVAAGEPAWPRFAGDARWFWAGLLVLLTVGALFRFVGLAYSDYQGDEARAALRAAAVLQGYEDVLMLHKKGPTEILVPTVLYTLTGYLTEQTARLPFAIANLIALLATFVLGWRLFRPLAGWIAALLLTLDGYFIGFAHIVQYQSVVFLASLLVVLVLYRLYVKPVAVARYLALAAILLATGMLSHYEGALAAIPAVFLLGLIFWDNRDRWRALLGATVIAAIVGAVVLGVFYVPFIFNERFAATYTYLTDRRIGGSPP
ncbi:MAG: glycosyltransferase family 39 protein, partial [Caldilineaceae bacterium]|nr:glycosyltransferase family 39 protein [Caldilineaceae bacterium]